MATPIQKEIKNASGFADVDELRDAMPPDPDVTGQKVPGAQPSPTRKARKPRTPTAPTPPPDPFLNDKRYQEACGRMAAFGGKGMIVRGFDAGAFALKDEKFKLDEKEELVWDDFFYVLSKKPFFDVGSPVYLAAFFILMLFAQLGWRVLERSESEFLNGLFMRKPKDENENAA